MKKLITISSMLVIIAVALVITLRNPILIKIPFGMARVLSENVEAEIYLDGHKSKSARLFREHRRFDGTQVDRLILWVDGGINERTILIIDLDENLVGIPNASKNDYARIFGKVIQSDSGDMYVPVTSAKAWPEHDLKFKSEKGIIEFELPECEWIPVNKLKIIAQPEP
jgi:hypothetical protein